MSRPAGTPLGAAEGIHGGKCVTAPELSGPMCMAGVLRLADGPDEVHLESIAKLELRRAV